jgi:restriction system protein
MPRKRESNLELLLKLPWWFSVALGVLVFIAMRWIIPARIDQNTSLHPFEGALVKLSPLPLFLFTLIAVGSFFFAKKRNRLVDEQTSLEKLRETSWKDFEFLVAEAYARLGFKVEYSLGQGADGGVDLTLRKDGRKSLVQCKQWKVFSVGAPVIREMFGLMTAEQADEAIIIVTGKFTRDAWEFAADKPIRLIDGPRLLALVQSVQTSSSAPSANAAATAATSVPVCPTCGQEMILRTSRRGADAGNQFWGCSSYPSCKGTRKV